MGRQVWIEQTILHFEYIFSEKMADPTKILALSKLPSSWSITEVKSFLQICLYNFYFIGRRGKKNLQ